MSAPPLMGRNAIIAIALAALAVSAYGVPVTSAHARSKAAGSQTAHHAQPHERSVQASAHPHERTATIHRPAKTTARRAGQHAHQSTGQPSARPTGRSGSQAITQAVAHKPTPAEVGRAAGLKIRSQLAANQRARSARYSQAVLRRQAGLQRQPELLRARYTPAVAARSVEVATVERPMRQPESGTMSGTTHYEAVAAESEPSRSASAGEDRGDSSITPAARASVSEASIPQSEAATPRPAPPVQMARRNVVPRPAAPAVSIDDTDATDSETTDAATPADHNAVHPSFARHAAVKATDPATELDDRVAPAREPVGENSDNYNSSEDARLKAETEQASLTIARGFMPAPLRGNRASLERQNARLEAEGLERIEDESDLAARIAHHLLVPVPASEALIVNSNLPVNHRYCRPWTARFLSDLASAHEAEFHRPLEVSSAVRTVAYQKRLMQVNGNAAPAEGDVVSPHMTGAAVDIPKDNLSRAEMAWMRRHLLAIEADGKIDVEEEFQQSCFHITVYKNYLPAYHPVPRHTQTPSQAHTGGAKGRTVHAPVADGPPAQGL